MNEYTIFLASGEAKKPSVLFVSASTDEKIRAAFPAADRIYRQTAQGLVPIAAAAS